MNATMLLPRPSATGQEIALEIELLGDDPSTFTRVLAVLHRRRCRVTRVDFRASTEHRPGWLVVRVVPCASHVHAVPAWLAGLVGVGTVTIGR
jgi:hypothetical protein